ncbi:hypothetical protein [Nocardioides dongkuii]|uniref:hypothetical protein n=1 Tax=Nocardioides dongkuii TaxID=2760089 RepID=UPI0015FE2A47|nr:hypothetical protein [Nocardioides dongkuii]
MSQDPSTDDVTAPADVSADVSADDQGVRTGVEQVDAVLAAIAQLEERPIEEHVGVFEAAHEQLRRALDVPNDAR